jgi:hypothetical protein
MFASENREIRNVIDFVPSAATIVSAVSKEVALAEVFWVKLVDLLTLMSIAAYELAADTVLVTVAAVAPVSKYAFASRVAPIHARRVNTSPAASVMPVAVRL